MAPVGARRFFFNDIRRASRSARARAVRSSVAVAVAVDSFSTPRPRPSVDAVLRPRARVLEISIGNKMKNEMKNTVDKHPSLPVDDPTHTEGPLPSHDSSWTHETGDNDQRTTNASRLARVTARRVCTNSSLSLDDDDDDAMTTGAMTMGAMTTGSLRRTNVVRRGSAVTARAEGTTKKTDGTTMTMDPRCWC